jgi:hypothetical protein
MSTVFDNVTGLQLAIKPDGKQTFQEGVVIQPGQTGLGSLIDNTFRGALAQLGVEALADVFNLRKLKIGGTISPDTLIVDASLPGKKNTLTVVDARIWMEGKARQPGPPKNPFPTAKGFAIQDAVIGFNLKSGSTSSELLINLTPVFSKKPKPLSIQKLINRIVTKPTKLSDLVRIEGVSLSNPGLLSSLAGSISGPILSRDAVLTAEGARSAFGGAWFDSGPVLG